MKLQKDLLDTKLKYSHEYDFLDELDDDEEEVVDADQDRVIHLVMQLRAAIDLATLKRNGYLNTVSELKNKEEKYSITFKSGPDEIALGHILEFLNKYDTMKPLAKEKMQSVASTSKESLYYTISSEFKGEVRPVERVVYGHEIRSRVGPATHYT